MILGLISGSGRTLVADPLPEFDPDAGDVATHSTIKPARRAAVAGFFCLKREV